MINKNTISSRAALALFNYEEFSEGNTVVTPRLINSHDGEHFFELRLHGNPIAELGKYHGLWITDAGWNTQVTRRRLNALPGVQLRGGSLSTTEFTLEEWDGKWIQIPYWGKQVDKLNEVA